MSERESKQKKAHKQEQKVIPVNTKAKDTFFKKVYENEERQRKLASFLLGIEAEKAATANVRPVLFGNKENDFSCLCDDIFYVLTEAQASVSPNIPYRLLEYATAGLRSMVDSEQLLYGRRQVYFPIPKLYVLQVGLEHKKEHLPQKVQYDMHLSELYRSATEKYGEEAPKPDLEATVHVYDFRMTLEEVLSYIEQGDLPKRFEAYDNDMRNYALVANGITYMQRTEKDARYKMPSNRTTVAEYLELLLERGIFVDLLSDKEVCDMTMAQFSRDDILIYQGREEGREEGREQGIKAFILDKVEDGVASSTIIQKLRKHFALDEDTAREYFRIYGKSE